MLRHPWFSQRSHRCRELCEPRSSPWRPPFVVLAGNVRPADAQTATAGQLLISEFRLSRFQRRERRIHRDLQQQRRQPHRDGRSGTGYGVAASDGSTRCSIPNGTVIPAGGHYLCVNCVGYSLATIQRVTARRQPATRPTRPTFPTTRASRSSTTTRAAAAFARQPARRGRLDVGSEHALQGRHRLSGAHTVRRSITRFIATPAARAARSHLLGPCTITTPKDTNNNAADFYLRRHERHVRGRPVSAWARPDRRTSRRRAAQQQLPATLLDPCVASSAPPNRVRDFTCDPANNSTFGTLDIRRTFTNNTGGSVTRLRFRVIDLDTFPAASGFADLRPRTSTSLVVVSRSSAVRRAARRSSRFRARRSSSRRRSPMAAALTSRSWPARSRSARRWRTAPASTSGSCSEFNRRAASSSLSTLRRLP